MKPHHTTWGIFICLIFFSSCFDTGFPDLPATESLHFSEGVCVFREKEKPLFLTATGDEIKGLNAGSIENLAKANLLGIGSFSSGYAPMQFSTDSREFFFMHIGQDGKPLSEDKYTYLGEFKDGSAVFKVGQAWGLVSDKGKVLVPARYEALTHGTGNSYWIRDKGAWFLLDRDKGERLNNEGFRIIGEFTDGITWVEKLTADESIVMRAYMNQEGTLLTPWYENARNFSEGLAGFKKNGKWGFLNTEGKEMIQPSFAYAGDFSDGLAPFTTKADMGFGKWGYLNTKGEEVISPQFEYAYGFSEGMAVVRDSLGRRGFINTKGELVIPYDYEDAYPFSEGLAAIKHQGKWGFINKSSKEVIAPLFDEIIPFPGKPFEAGFSEGMAKVEVAGRQFMVNKEGKCVMACLE